LKSAIKNIGDYISTVAKDKMLRNEIQSFSIVNMWISSDRITWTEQTIIGKSARNRFSRIGRTRKERKETREKENWISAELNL
jgi:hypothetical protein